VAINILIVDDSGVMRSMIIKTLRMTEVPLGEIHQAGNGREGLDVLGEQWIDLAIVDINMPVMNGEEMIDRMHEDPEMKGLPVIVVSTEGSKARIERLEHKGAVFIHKPFTAEVVRDTINSILGLGENDES
jgi:two-component system chemotaxis response regulator CheY